MKKKQEITIQLPPAKLFLEDLEQIDEILKEHSVSYTLTLDEFELEPTDRIESIKEKQDFFELTIMGSRDIKLSSSGDVQSYFRFRICDFMSVIFASDEPIYYRIIEKIRPIIKKRRKILYYFPISVLPILFGGINYSLYYYFITHYDYENLSNLVKYTLFTVFILLTIAIIMLTPILINHKKVVFTSKKYSEQTNYFTRNKDQVITSLISGLIGLITGLTIALFRFNLTCQ